jgi:WD40 repeat protein
LKELSHDPAAWHRTAKGAGLRRNGCTPNTRVAVLKKLGGWAYDEQSEKIYWLNGMAGTGKTTITYSLCDQLVDARKLGAGFFCSRDQPACRDVNLIIPNIAFQLARFSRPFYWALSRVLKQTPEVHTAELPVQFEKMIVNPMKEISHTMPTDLVVTIDALDECEDKDGVSQILETLFSHASTLSVKFFVTSRPEPEIRDRMLKRQGERARFELHLHDLEHSIVQEDIRTYLKVTLEPIDISDKQLDRLVEQSGVLFIYASTVARYIGHDNFAKNPRRRLETMLAVSQSSANDINKGIDALYTAVLRAAWDDPGLSQFDKDEMEIVLRTVLCAQEPMTVAMLAGLLGLDSEGSVQAALRSLLSVLCIAGTNGLVTTLHASFPDYMLDEKRSVSFYCDKKLHNGLLAQKCFDTMKIPDPPFNICGLESSYIFDRDVPNLQKRVESAISKELLYACRYWGAHLELTEALQYLVDELIDFLSVRLLLWMEVMNLKQYMNLGARMLSRVHTWSQVSFQWSCTIGFLIIRQNPRFSNDTEELTRDASRFVTTFCSSPVALSTPHIYVSALPFWSKQRLVFKIYSQRMKGAIKVAGTAMGRRESAKLVSWSNESMVYSVACSPNGAHIVSGSDDNTIRIWDAHSGQMIGEPLRGHTWSVTSVAYSPNGAHIVSGSGDKTIRIWDAHSGQMIGEPLQGHTESVRSVAYSPNGAHIVSGSSDNTIRIWDAHSGQMIGEPLQGHTGSVTSVAYSPNGAHIVSGSNDNTIRIWDARSGQRIGEPLQGHTGSVRSVAYSPNGAHIVSGSYDKTIRIWDEHRSLASSNPPRGLAGNESTVGELLSSHPLHSSLDQHRATPLGFSSRETEHPCIQWVLNEDGWAVDGLKLVIWVPPDVRDVLLRPQNRIVISTQGSVRLDFSNAKIGEVWNESYQPANSMSTIL